MTAAELREIGERIRKGENRCGLDRALLYEALERLIERDVIPCVDGCFVLRGVMGEFDTKDAAIDALLKEQPQ